MSEESDKRQKDDGGELSRDESRMETLGEVGRGNGCCDGKQLFLTRVVSVKPLRIGSC